MNLSFKNFYWRWIKNQLLMFIFMLILMTGARLVFSFLFGSIPELESNQEAFKKALFL